VLSPDGALVAMNATNAAYVWRLADLAAGPVRLTFNRRFCYGLAWTPAGEALLAAVNDGTVRRLDPLTGAEGARHTFAAGRMTSLAVAPDGLTAAVGTDRGQVVVFDLD
jgi:WD40 repeat protein